MREYKFRAWDTTAKKMYDISKVEGYPIEYLAKGDTPYTKFMQYTGLKDKNGKEIYEGDILPSADKVNGKIIYEEELSAFAVEYPNYKQLLMDYRAEYTNGFEVIGNIYETKDGENDAQRPDNRST